MARATCLLNHLLRPWALVRAACVVMVALWAQGCLAQGVESIMAPGKLSRAHAKYEDQCEQCHVRFDRQAQDGRCLDCHKETRADVNAHTGYHGKMKQQACRTCHTEHKGPDGRLVVLDKTQFDHRQTDYALLGKHQKVLCEKCHVSGKKYREAPTSCVDCHRADDTHKGSLGAKCADCHTETSWKEAKFDHDKTRFSLTGKHTDTKCADCHAKGVYKDTPRTCVACHRKDDDHKGHKGLLGEKCESCHGTKAWKPATFNHDVDTKYVLRGKHATVKCADCHGSTNPYRVKTSQECYACHKKDDKHNATLGTKCADCHTDRDWKATRFDHDKTRFQLRRGHADPKLTCVACHKDVQSMRNTAMDCVSCHKKDDKHEGTLGTACADCHTDASWKLADTKFDHAKTRFALRNAHADPKVTCKSCHSDQKHLRNTAMDCFSCHKKDDKHEGQEGKQCESCHTDRNWKIERFDHNRTRFGLNGKHTVTECKSCHLTLRFRDAKRECVACHLKEDKHKQVFGTRCESCHNARGWAVWSFDHTTKTRYRLDGAHLKVACESCHREVAPVGKDAAPLATNCYSCHRDKDPHEGKFGAQCQQCHLTTNWKTIKGRFGSASDMPQGLWLVAQAIWHRALDNGRSAENTP